MISSTTFFNTRVIQKLSFILFIIVLAAHVALDSSGNVYLADLNNNQVKKFTPVSTAVRMASSEQAVRMTWSRLKFST